MTAIFLLGEGFGNKESTVILTSLWYSINENTEDKEKFLEKMNVATSLWLLGEKEYINYVFDRIKSENPDKRAEAAMLLGRIDSGQSRDSLIEILKNETFFPALFIAAMSLGEIGTKEVIPILEKKKEENLINLNQQIDKSIKAILVREESNNKNR